MASSSLLLGLLLTSFSALGANGDSDESVQGPVVIQHQHQQTQVQETPPPKEGSEDVGHQFGELLEAALKSEFGNGTQQLNNGTFNSFLNSTNHENEEVIGPCLARGAQHRRDLG